MANDVYIEGIQYNSENNNAVSIIRLPSNSTSNDLSLFYATNDANAEPEDVITGKVFYNENGKQIGSLDASSIISTIGQAVGPRLRSNSPPINGTQVSYDLNYHESLATNMNIKTANTNYTDSSPSKLIDLGDNYFLALHSNLDYNIALTGTVIKGAIDSEEHNSAQKGTSIPIGGTNSALYFSAVPLTTGAAEYENLTTNYVFICFYSEEDLNIKCNLLYIDKENLSFSILTSLLLDDLNNNNLTENNGGNDLYTTELGNAPMYCTIINYNPNINAWYIVIAHLTEGYQCISSIKVAIESNIINSISYGFSYISSISEYDSDSYCLKIIRINDTSFFVFAPCGPKIQYLLYSNPLVINYNQQITNVTYADFLREIDFFSSYSSNRDYFKQTINKAFDILYINKIENETSIEYTFFIIFGYYAKSDELQNSSTKAGYDRCFMQIAEIKIIQSNNSFSRQLIFIQDISLPEVSNSNVIAPGGDTHEDQLCSIQELTSFNDSGYSVWPYDGKIKCFRIGKNIIAVFHPDARFRKMVIRKIFFNLEKQQVFISEDFLHYNTSHNSKLNQNHFDAMISVATGLLYCIGEKTLSNLKNNISITDYNYESYERTESTKDSAFTPFGETEYDNTPFNNNYYKTRFYNNDPTKTADIFYIFE